MSARRQVEITDLDSKHVIEDQGETAGFFPFEPMVPHDPPGGSIPSLPTSFFR